MFTNLLLIAILLIGTNADRVNDSDLSDLISMIFDKNAGLPTTTELTSPLVMPSDRMVFERNPVRDRSSYQICGTGKVCVSKYLCSKGKVSTDGTLVLDVRMDDDEPVAQCSLSETCCSIPVKVYDSNDNKYAGFATTTENTTPSVKPPNPMERDSSSYQKCGTGKVCVSKYLCSGGKVNTDGTLVLDVRMDDDEPVTQCSLSETCCSIPVKVYDPNDYKYAGSKNTTENTIPSVKPPNPMEHTKTPVRDGSSLQKCGTGKVCVSKYLCSRGKANTDGSSLFNPRIDDDEPVAQCPLSETCCSIDVTVDDHIDTPVGTPKGCGYRNNNGVGIPIKANDNEAQFGEFPWMVAIFQVKERKESQGLVVYKFKCGGSLITPEVVITGASCVHTWPESNFKIRAGEWEMHNTYELYPAQERKVVDVIVHENYNRTTLENNIALLIVGKSFNLTPNVNTICLPPANFNFDLSHCYATGWGKDQFRNGVYQNILKKINLPVVPNAQCQADLRKTRLGRDFRLHGSFMCAGGQFGRDTCKGDGGSPLVCPMSSNSNRYYQIGIVSWGIGCGDENVPGVYANVPYLRRWIDQQLANEAIEATHFTP